MAASLSSLLDWFCGAGSVEDGEKVRKRDDNEFVEHLVSLREFGGNSDLQDLNS